ncbi:FISUMP domain-containing protein [Winogradskyella vidalii]|uniref:FISUMP domain-containing protein n=1 Tax=Winogradskyella vidalii TaxID=2615024 RepID=UPI0015C8F363|nr:FISUMP domain-containing protein [Winogradskyella vidalii]
MKNLAIFFSLLLFFGCSKDDNNTTSDENPNQQDAEVAENVVVISNENSDLISSETDLSNGIYILEFENDPPEVNIDDIIVGDEGEGFLRKIVSIDTNGNSLTLETTQATLDDLFNNASLEFTSDISESSRSGNRRDSEITINYAKNGVTVMDDGVDYNFSNTTLYDNSGLTFKITSGTAKFNPSLHFKADYTLFGGLDYFNFETDNATLEIDCDLLLNASGSVNLPEFSTTLIDFDKKITILLGGAPVIVTINTELIAELNAGIDASASVTSGFTNNYSFTSSIKHEDDIWTANFDLDSDLTPKDINFNGEVNLAQNLTITPKVTVKLYSVIGPYCEPKMTEDFTLNVASPSLDWDSELKVGLDLTTGFIITIMDHNITPYSRTDNFEDTIWSAPKTLEIISGNGQNGTQEEALTNPLVVKVTDLLGNPISNVPVYYTITEGDGTVENESVTSVMTDGNGLAQAIWTLGNASPSQTVEVTVKKANGADIQTPVTFNATSESTIFIDPRDGKEYNLVTIGNQTWFAENLNYDSGSGACYDNNTENCDTYGRLYSWSAANSACPDGTHLPSSFEWEELVTNLGGSDIAGGKMKSTTLWSSPNTGATNESGFSALPGGSWTTYPPPSGSYGNSPGLGYWWTSDQNNVVLSATDENVATASPNTEFKFSCRCLLD